MALQIPVTPQKEPDIYTYAFGKDLYRESPTSNPVIYDLFKDLTSTNLLNWGNIPPQIFLPPGMMAPFGGTTVPNGWLFCDGSAVSRTTYNSLFSIIGTVFGSGNGSTTFNLPDLRGRGTMGKSTETFTAIGLTGGEQTHKIVIAELAAHTHPIKTYAGLAGGYVKGGQNTTFEGQPQSTESTGGDTPINVLDPYLVVNFIIKY